MALDYALGRTRMDEMELHGVRSLKTGRFTITAVTIDGQLLMPTREFWEDLFKRYQLTSGWAEGKSHARRFEFLAAHHGGDEIPYRVMWDESGNAWVAPSRRRKIRRKKETTPTDTSYTLDSRCREAAPGLRCIGAAAAMSYADETQDGRLKPVLQQQDETNEAADWLRTRRRRINRHRSNHGRPATRKSRLSNFFRGGRS